MTQESTTGSRGASSVPVVDRLARFDAPNNSGPLLRIDAMTDARLSASENTERSAAICGLAGKFRTGEKA